MADDDVAAERARLEALAWGGGVDEDEAARARRALQELPDHARVTVRDGSTQDRSGGATRPGASVPSSAWPGPERGPAVVGTLRPDGFQPGAPWPGGGPIGDGPLTGGGPSSERREQEDVPAAASALPTRDAHLGRGDQATEGDDGGGDEPRLQSGPQTWRARATRLLWTRRPRVWIALGAAAAVGVAFAAGTLVGTSAQESQAAPSVTPTAGTVTLEQLLDAPQTYADQLPGPVESPVSLRTTRLVFTNRALDGSAFETPWSVWAGVGTDRSTICLVATANRIESTSACYPRDDALHGSISLSAQSMSGTLTLTVRGGGVQGTVTNGN